MVGNIETGERISLKEVVGVSWHFLYHLPRREERDAYLPHLKSKGLLAEVSLSLEFGDPLN